MLSPEERQEIEAEFLHYPTKQALSIDAMRIVQKHRGWVSDEALDDIGELLGMSGSDLDGVATFYNLIFRKPVGKHVVYLCDSVSCWIMGCRRLGDHLTARLDTRFGETTADSRFTLLPIVCLGACDHAPVMMIDDDLHLDLEPAKVDEILDRYR
ncbi:MAG TPA: NADH-quinone oxidoreductase subunit NuoE [Bryobacteraceae bacterium]|jgi:NADH-quinone oxidoreductase subunit E|nr:NADH-quinone oxidoreductase subunit NuoE [Bryobacteraceae bacterium]HXJ44110.1 NADH-quinone oxidoreductase subunit NuoE [Bryobacteraceae bacterium]